jgi:formate dehydrogenase iron-sulfur subunit
MNTEVLTAGPNLLDKLLEEQQHLTAVERFSQKHAGNHEPTQARYYRDLIPLTRPGKGEQYAFEVNLDACSSCKACVSACHSLNGLDEDEAWRDVSIVTGLDAELQPVQQTVTSACHHCADPACADGCPTLAYEKDSDTGVVRHLDDQCIGCQYCQLKCPYDVPKFSKSRGIVRKCDMCHERLAEGEAPACVQACPSEAIRIRIVPIEEIDLAASTGKKLLPGTVPSSYTRPSTRFLNSRVEEECANSNDNAAPQPEHCHFPLVWMLVLTQISVGILVAATILKNPPTALPWLAAITGLLGICCSVLHLGRPQHAWKAFLGWRKSWLSREIIAFNFWLPPLAFTAFGWLPAWPALLTGALAVACSIMVYIDTRREFWSAKNTVPRFLGTIAVTAVLTITACSSSPSFLLPATIILAKLLIESLALLPLRSNQPSHAKATAQLLAVPLRRITTGRVALALCALGILSALTPAAIIVAAFLLTLGELIERSLYFKAVSAPKMPGLR